MRSAHHFITEHIPFATRSSPPSLKSNNNHSKEEEEKKRKAMRLRTAFSEPGGSLEMNMRSMETDRKRNQQQ
jgi:hypothetical protein